jgi:hypothetical protein
MLESESESDTSVTCWWVGRHDNGRWYTWGNNATE